MRGIWFHKTGVRQKMNFKSMPKIYLYIQVIYSSYFQNICHCLALSLYLFIIFSPFFVFISFLSLCASQFCKYLSLFLTICLSFFLSYYLPIILSLSHNLSNYSLSLSLSLSLDLDRSIEFCGVCIYWKEGGGLEMAMGC